MDGVVFKRMDDITPFTAGDFTEIREILHPKNDRLAINYSIALAELEAGKNSVPHILRESSEVYILLEGQGEAVVNGKTYKMKTGDMVHIPAGAEQYFNNTGSGKVRFLCVVSPPWSKEQEEILDK